MPFGLEFKLNGYFWALLNIKNSYISLCPIFSKTMGDCYLYAILSLPFRPIKDTCVLHNGVTSFLKKHCSFLYLLFHEMFNKFSDFLMSALHHFGLPLKYGFCKNYFDRNEPLTSWTLLSPVFSQIHILNEQKKWLIL